MKLSLWDPTLGTGYIYQTNKGVERTDDFFSFLGLTEACCQWVLQLLTAMWGWKETSFVVLFAVCHYLSVSNLWIVGFIVVSMGGDFFHLFCSSTNPLVLQAVTVAYQVVINICHMKRYMNSTCWILYVPSNWFPSILTLLYPCTSENLYPFY